MLKLTKSQQKFVAQRHTRQAVIRGEKHTGKTTMGIGRMIYLVNHKCEDEMLFVAANSTECKSAAELFEAEYNRQTMSLFESEGCKTEILSIDSLMMQLYELLFGTYKGEVLEEIDVDVLQTAIIEVKKQYPRAKFLNEAGMAFICDELNWINSCGYTRLEDYGVAARKGCAVKLPKNGRGRCALWAIKENVDKQLVAKNQILKLALQAKVLEASENLKKSYKHLIIDDSHMLTKVQLQVLKAIHYGGELLFLMDKNPCEARITWLKRGQTFKQVGFNMTGRMRQLRGSKKSKAKQLKKAVLTPLEIFMAEMARKKKSQTPKQSRSIKGIKPIEGVQMSFQNNAYIGNLPWYVETYKYVNKLTGVETVFQKDTSAGETYIDEVKQESVAQLPLYASDIAAGQPIEVVDEISERFEIPGELVNNKRGTYMLHVQGDSMINAQINDGDYVIIQAGAVNNNEIAAVYYNGATTLKRIVQEEDHILLVSENPKYRPIVIEDDDFRVMGKLIGVIKPVM
ncbi:LexA family protein [Cellulosilyticum ruminicola]|uniref:LexA family protein n=1 Tax=Cellulosilyticum ruminicola TaxID=425254 RepID=UPI0006D02676|nr:S24 family peptidase [Cellulosilyticum ruminicola]